MYTNRIKDNHKIEQRGSNHPDTESSEGIIKINASDSINVRTEVGDENKSPTSQGNTLERYDSNYIQTNDKTSLNDNASGKVAIYTSSLIYS